MAWIAITQEMLLNSMSEDLRLQYSQWIQDPQKQENMAFIVNNTTSEFRTAIGNNPSNILGPAGTIPDSCARHAINIIIGTMLMQFDAQLSPEARNAMEKADIFLRQVGYGKYKMEPGGDAGSVSLPTPRYSLDPAEQPERALPCEGI